MTRNLERNYLDSVLVKFAFLDLPSSSRPMRSRIKSECDKPPTVQAYYAQLLAEMEKLWPADQPSPAAAPLSVSPITENETELDDALRRLATDPEQFKAEWLAKRRKEWDESIWLGPKPSNFDSVIEQTLDGDWRQFVSLITRQRKERDGRLIARSAKQAHPRIERLYTAPLSFLLNKTRDFIRDWFGADVKRREMFPDVELTLKKELGDWWIEWHSYFPLIILDMDVNQNAGTIALVCNPGKFELYDGWRSRKERSNSRMFHSASRVSRQVAETGVEYSGRIPYHAREANRAGHNRKTDTD